MQGTAELSVRMLEAGLEVVGPPAQRVRWIAGAGATLTSLSVVGEAEAPYRGVRDDAWTLGVLGRGAAVVALTPRLAVRLELGALMTPHPVELRFVDQAVATWGRPTAFVTVAMESALDW